MACDKTWVYATCRSGAVWEGGGNMRRVVGEGGCEHIAAEQ